MVQQGESSAQQKTKSCRCQKLDGGEEKIWWRRGGGKGQSSIPPEKGKGFLGRAPQVQESWQLKMHFFRAFNGKEARAAFDSGKRIDSTIPGLKKGGRRE